MRDGGLNSKVQDNGHTQMNGNSLGSKSDSAEPWWRPKTVKNSEIEPMMDDQNASSYGTTGSNGLPVQRGWVPPQPPSVAVPEAMSAIWQPKSMIQKEQTGDEQLKPSEGGNDETARITEVSKAAAVVERPDGMADFNPSERQEERDNSIKVN